MKFKRKKTEILKGLNKIVEYISEMFSLKHSDGGYQYHVKPKNMQHTNISHKQTILY